MLISIIVPTCHRNDLLAKCLDRLAPEVQSDVVLCAKDSARADRQSGTAESPFLGATVAPNPKAVRYEVIVTDDGKDATAEQMIGESYPWATWLPGPRRGPASNRNNGAR